MNHVADGEAGLFEPASAEAMLARMARGEIRAGDLLRQALARIRAVDGELKAFVRLAAETDADACPPPSPARPLSGLPVAIKDIFDTADLPTAYGSAAWAGHRPAVDAALVTALRQAGAVVLGKTTTTEFAAWPPTPTLNPAAPGRTPGGSSAGSAAAVAAGLAPVAFGTQTLGSVIRPASFCGVVGFKPSRGRLSPVGVKALASSLDTPGLFARSVADAALVFGALSPEPAAALPASPRLAAMRPHPDRAAPDAAAAFDACLVRLRAAGFAVRELPLPADWARISADGRLVHDFEMRRGLLPDYLARGPRMSASMVEGIERAAAIPAAEHAAALERLQAARGAASNWFADVDAVLCLAAPGEAPEGLASTGDAIMNVAWTALHMPCVTLPAMRGAHGAPIGLQVVGARQRDAALLAVAATLEAALIPGAAAA